jgi:hypothetical protein
LISDREKGHAKRASFENLGETLMERIEIVVKIL